MSGKAGFFSGLVKGFGGGMQQMHQQQREREDRDRQTSIQIALSAASDPNLPGAAKRQLMMDLGTKFGLKIDPALVEHIVPDYQVDTGRNINAQTPQSTIRNIGNIGEIPGGQPYPERPSFFNDLGQPPAWGDFPNRPASVGDRVPTGSIPISDSVPNINMQGGMQPTNQAPGWGQQQSQQMVQPMRGQMAEPTAPVIKDATAGIGSTITPIDQRVEQMRVELRAGMPARPRTLSSLQMSPAQIEESRAERIYARRQQAEMEQQRQLEAIRLSNQTSLMDHEYNLRRDAGKADAELDLEKARQATMQKVQTANAVRASQGQPPLTPEEVNQLLGIEVSNIDRQRRADAQDQQILATGDPNSPEYKAAKARVDAQAADTTYRQVMTKVAVIGAQADLIRATNARNMNDPAAQEKAKVISQQKVRQAIGGRRSIQLINQRTKQILKENMDELGIMGEISGATPAMRAQAMKQAKEEIAQVQQQLEGDFYSALIAGHPIDHIIFQSRLKSDPNVQPLIEKGLSPDQIQEALEGMGFYILDDSAVESMFNNSEGEARARVGENRTQPTAPVSSPPTSPSSSLATPPPELEGNTSLKEMIDDPVYYSDTYLDHMVVTSQITTQQRAYIHAIRAQQKGKINARVGN